MNLGSRISHFQSAGGPPDAIPDDFGDEQLSDMDISSSRLAGDFEDSSLYLDLSKTGEPCLAVYPVAVVVCGGQGTFGTTLLGVGEFDVAPAPRESKEGWTLVGDNILAKGF